MLFPQNFSPNIHLQVSKKTFLPVNINFNLKNYVNKFGECQVYMVLTSDGKRKRIPLDIYVKPVNWDKAKQRAKAKTHDCEAINFLLDTVFAKISSIRVHYRLSNLHLTLDRLVEEFQNKTPDYDFIAFMKHHTENMVLSKNSKKKHKSEIKKIEEFKKFIPFSEITLEFVNSYRGWLSREKKNQSTTIASSLKFISKFLRLAKKYGIFLNLDIDDIKPGSTAGNRVNLSIQEVARLKAYYESDFIKDNHKLILGYFLFSCYTSLRISDIRKLHREDIVGESFSFVSTKTNKIHSITLNKTAKEIVSKNSDLFVRWITDQKINFGLKEIANVCSIKKKMHFHVARHSFATNFLRKGGKVEDLQVIMDHSDISTTMEYVHIVKVESMKSMFLMDD